MTKKTRIRDNTPIFDISKINVLDYEGLCVNVANDYRWSGIEFDDLKQEAWLGVLTAYDIYDPTKGKSFQGMAKSYARFFVHELAIKQHTIIDVQSTSRIVKPHFNALRKALDSDSSKTKYQIIMDYANEHNLTESQVMKVVTHIETSFISTSINIGKDGENSITLLDTISSKEDLEEHVLDERENEFINRNISKFVESTNLTDNQRDVIKDMYFTETPKKMTAIAKEKGVSCERIRQHHSNSINKLKDFFSEIM